MKIEDMNLSPDAIKALFSTELRTVEVPLQKLEWRQSDSGDGSRILTGYAAVYEQETVLYDGMHWTFKEIIHSNAFNNVLAKSPDVHLNIGHDMTRAIARTGVSGVGTLELTSDTYGLKVYARLNPKDPDVVALSEKMDIGIMDQMSFAFQVKANGCKYESITDDDGHEFETRIITEIAELYDVCVCAQGAYPQTEAVLRSLENIIKQRSTEVVDDKGQRSDEVARDADGADNSLVERKRIALLARAKLAKIQYK